MTLPFHNMFEALGRRRSSSGERLLAISWNAQQVTILEATRNAGDLQAHATDLWAWPEGLSPTADPEAAGRWLKGQLEQRAVSTQATVLVLPRHAAILKLMEVPELPADELAALVHLQAESRSGGASGAAIMDFVPIPDQRHALLVSVLSTTVEPSQRLLSAAGLRCVAMTVGELQLRETLPEASGLQLGIHREGARTELLLSFAGAPLASLTSRCSSADEVEQRQAIAASAVRLLATLPMSLSAKAITSVALFGAEANQLFPDESLAGLSAGQTVRRCTATSATYVPLELALGGRIAPETAINLVAPRRPRDRGREVRRRHWLLAAGGLALLAVAAWSLFDYSQRLTAAIDHLKQRDRDLTDLQDRARPLVEAASFVGEWERGQTDWPSTLGRFIESLPDHERAFLTQLDLEIASDGITPVIRIQGQAKEARDVLELHQRLLTDEAGYELRPHGIEPNTRDPDYRATFEIEAAIPSGSGT